MKKLVHHSVALCAAISLVLIQTGCFQGNYSEKPPVHINPNMDTQPKYKPLKQSEFFADSAAMRTLVPGTVARGHLNENIPYYTGRVVEGGDFVKTSPVPLTIDLLKRGQQRFNIYCAPCHGAAGDGQGIVFKRGLPIMPSNYHDLRLIEMPDGQMFDAITNGVRNMPSYKHQVPVADRWAIIAYIRALQKSQNIPAAQVPEDIRRTLK